MRRMAYWYMIKEGWQIPFLIRFTNAVGGSFAEVYKRRSGRGLYVRLTTPLPVERARIPGFAKGAFGQAMQGYLATRTKGAWEVLPIEEYAKKENLPSTLSVLMAVEIRDKLAKEA